MKTRVLYPLLLIICLAASAASIILIPFKGLTWAIISFVYAFSAVLLGLIHSTERTVISKRALYLIDFLFTSSFVASIFISVFLFEGGLQFSFGGNDSAVNLLYSAKTIALFVLVLIFFSWYKSRNKYIRETDEVDYYKHLYRLLGDTSMISISYFFFSQVLYLVTNNGLNFNISEDLIPVIYIALFMFILVGPVLTNIYEKKAVPILDNKFN